MRKAALLFLLLPAVLLSGCASTSAGVGAALMFWHNYGASASDEDGAYYSWTAGQADTVWNDAEYTAGKGFGFIWNPRPFLYRNSV